MIMKKGIKLLCLVLAAATIFSSFSLMGFAKSKVPFTLKLETSSDCTSTMGSIKVKITLKNTSGKNIKNLIVSSCDSKGLVFYKTKQTNVTITEPGCDCVTHQKNSKTACLKKGAVMKYDYNVLVGYKYAEEYVSDSVHSRMYVQHCRLQPNYFREVSVPKGVSRFSVSKTLCFGGIKTTLKVTAYYNMSDKNYKNAVSAAEAAETADSSYSSSASSSESAYNYIVDTSTKKFHLQTCSHLPTVNRSSLYKTRSEMIQLGYSPCSYCNP